jgi:hypothetical protein
MRVFGSLLEKLDPHYRPEPPCPRREYALQRLSWAQGVPLEVAREWLDRKDAEAIEVADALAVTSNPYRFVVWQKYH